MSEMQQQRFFGKEGKEKRRKPGVSLLFLCLCIQNYEKI